MTCIESGEKVLKVLFPYFDIDVVTESLYSIEFLVAEIVVVVVDADGGAADAVAVPIGADVVEGFWCHCLLLSG